MKIAYRDPKNIQHETKELLDKIITVANEYQSQGYTLSLRQLYYQLVTEIIIENDDRNYAKVSKILGDARMCGQIDWDIIEDRTRIPDMHSEWNNIQDLVDSAIDSYRKDRQVNQDNYVEVWVEKDALSGILSPITNEYHVNLMVNRGYSSISAMHDASMRFSNATNNNKNCHILYLGDHDPSGLDMIRDIECRLTDFNVSVLIHPIALTMKQIKKYNPPPNPTKFKDPRSTDYIKKFGKVSWELDAIKPQVLDKLLRRELEKLIDMIMYNDIVESEEPEKAKLIKLKEKI